MGAMLRARRGRPNRRPTIVAVIPVSGQDPEFSHGLPQLGGRPLMAFTFDAARESRRLSRIVVSTDDRRIAQAAREAGLDVPFVRPRATRRQPIAGVLDAVARHLERHAPQAAPDWIVRLQVTYPFRVRGMIDRAIASVLAQDLDSAFMAFPEFDTFWNLTDDGAPERITTDTRVPRSRRRPIYRELGGLFSMVRRDVLAGGSLYGNRLGILPITSVVSAIDIHAVHGRDLAALIADARRRPGRRT
jgi:N-acylneuraminate cytidylyltransferase